MTARTRTLAALAGLLVIAGGATALADTTFPAVSVKAKISPSKAGTKKHPQGEKLKVEIDWQNLGPATQPIVTSFNILFPKGAKYNGNQYPSCSRQKLDNLGPQACPKGSLMGSGTGNAFADTVITHPQITVVNGGAKTIYFYTVLNNPARVQTAVVGNLTNLHGKYAYQLNVKVPAELQVVAGVPIALTKLTVNAGKQSWLETTSCGPGGKWPFQVTTAYKTTGSPVQTGSQTFTDNISCK